MNMVKDRRAILVVASLGILVAGMMMVVVASTGTPSSSRGLGSSSSLALTSSNSTIKETAATTSISLPPTNDSQACFTNINSGVAQQSFLTPQENASLLEAAESSSQYAAFVQQTGTTPSLGNGSPGMEYSTSFPDCSGLYVTGFSYCFAARSAGGTFPPGEPELCLSVSPATMTTNGCMVTPVLNYGNGTGGGEQPQWPEIANCTG
jgi:hypothetical protein